MTPAEQLTALLSGPGAELLGRLGEQIRRVNTDLAEHDPADYLGLGALAGLLQKLQAEESDLETRWLELSDQAG